MLASIHDLPGLGDATASCYTGCHAGLPLPAVSGHISVTISSQNQGRVRAGLSPSSSFLRLQFPVSAD